MTTETERPAEEPPPLTMHEAAEYLKVSFRTVERLVYGKKVGVVKFGRLNRIPLKELQKINANGFPTMAPT